MRNKKLIDLRKLSEKYGEDYDIIFEGDDLVAVGKKNNLRINLTLYFKTLKERFNKIKK